MNAQFDIALAAQGARCGWLDGRKRVGAYVIGEELLYAEDAAACNVQDPAHAGRWADGYATGYVIGASGEELPTETQNYPLPYSEVLP